MLPYTPALLVLAASLWNTPDSEHGQEAQPVLIAPGPSYARKLP
jgi:hypothetical protein